MTSSLAAETQALRDFYSAINRNDMAAILGAFDPQIVRTEPAGFPMSGTYRGHAELKAHFSRARETWAEGTCEPERFVVAGDKIVAFVHVHVRLKDSAEWIDAHMADGYAFRDGKATHYVSFADPREALEWAGVEATDEI